MEFTFRCCGCCCSRKNEYVYHEIYEWNRKKYEHKKMIKCISMYAHFSVISIECRFNPNVLTPNVYLIWFKLISMVLKIQKKNDDSSSYSNVYMCGIMITVKHICLKHQFNGDLSNKTALISMRKSEIHNQLWVHQMWILNRKWMNECVMERLCNGTQYRWFVRNIVQFLAILWFETLHNISDTIYCWRYTHI